MNQRKIRLLRLHDSPNVTRPLLAKMFQADPELLLPFRLTPQELSSHFQLPLIRATAIHQYIHHPNIMKKLDTFLHTYQLVTLFDETYPDLLRTIPDPPYVLYLQGNPDILSTSLSLSVIGTRTPSKDGYQGMRTLLPPVIEKGYTIVSGMAKGVDQYAHKLAITHGGTTIAILGSGFQHIYPKNDIDLYRKIARDHLVISEYSPDRRPQKYHFPERNRLISGLTPATFVVEARVKSGSQITVDQALEQGREVYAMPGRPLSPTSEGCHQMINDGATLVHRPEDLLSEWSEKFE
ncbi:DNA-protecting protein DprA [Halobacillus fulvus]|nr:DNA-protecting protein DprA [Halobacillus fulvus]